MKTETLRVRSVVDTTRLGAWLQSGEGIGWLTAGTMPNSLYRVPFVYLFLACVFCYSCTFFFVVFCVFVFCFCAHWSLVDVPLIFFCPADHVPDWQPRILLGMVEARSVNVKKTTTVVRERAPRAVAVQHCLEYLGSEHPYFELGGSARSMVQFERVLPGAAPRVAYVPIVLDGQVSIVFDVPPEV